MADDLFLGLGSAFWTAFGGFVALLALGVTLWQARKPPSPFRRHWPIHRLNLSEPSRDVQGRGPDAAALRRALVRSSRAVIHGDGGLGKTTLARYYIKLYDRHYEGILWLNAETSPAADLAAAATTLEAQTAPDMTQEEKARASLAALAARRHPWLVIYDNARDEAAISALLLAECRAHVLVTARDAGWSPRFAHLSPQPLPCTTVAAPGPQVLMTEARRRDDPDGALGLARELGGYPLALVVAGALVRDGYDSFDGLARNIARIVAAGEGSDYRASLAAAVQLSYDRLDPDARIVIDLFAWWDADGLEARLLTDVPAAANFGSFATEIPDELIALCRDPGRVRDALAALRRLSLLGGEAEAGHSLHRMTAAALRHLQADRAPAAIRVAAAVLAASYPQRPSDSQNWPACARLTPHVLAFRRAAWDRAPALEAVDYLYNQASIYLRAMALADPALDLAKEALRLTTRRHGPAHRDVARPHSVLGSAYADAGRVDEALAEQREAVRLCKAHDHPPADLALALCGLASALQGRHRSSADRADLQEALRLWARALELGRAEFGAESADVAAILHNLATTLADLGDREEALVAQRESVRILELSCLPGDARLGYGYHDLGACLLEDGAAAEAAECVDRALAIWRAVLPTTHPLMAHAAMGLTVARLRLGDRVSARALAEEFGLDLAECQVIADRLPSAR